MLRIPSYVCVALHIMKLCLRVYSLSWVMNTLTTACVSARGNWRMSAAKPFKLSKFGDMPETGAERWSNHSLAVHSLIFEALRSG